ncbi:hypothetical protein XBO1_2270014 [Xenorhabdus bovienii str. oregonense]|uniref:Transposase n=1 Tax=Xenorhabdus bovienii str. oregonense TaxID=1398202 RepID=A0A077P762_XENBV|nr:hypothetical protein XBO1_2270014 [Xenorhabdus bovienii str. oregonense]
MCQSCRHSWQREFTYAACRPGTHKQIVNMADGWRSYEKTLAGKLHVVSKRYTQRIERHNLNLRQHLARLTRKTLSFSKSIEIHDRVIGYYLNIHHYQ